MENIRICPECNGTMQKIFLNIKGTIFYHYYWKCKDCGIIRQQKRRR